MHVETSHQCIPLSAKSNSAGKKPTNLPGWNENVAPAKKDALFWHSVWMSAGRPNQGELYNDMCWARNKFHYAVRKAKRLAGNIQSMKLLEAAEMGDIALMAEMKKKTLVRLFQRAMILSWKDSKNAMKNYTTVQGLRMP